MNMGLNIRLEKRSMTDGHIDFGIFDREDNGDLLFLVANPGCPIREGDSPREVKWVTVKQAEALPNQGRSFCIDDHHAQMLCDDLHRAGFRPHGLELTIRDLQVQIWAMKSEIQELKERTKLKKRNLPMEPGSGREG